MRKRKKLGEARLPEGADFSILRSQGFSLLEVMIALGVLGVVSLIVIGINNLALKGSTGANIYHQADQFRKNIISVINNEDAWKATVNYNSPANNRFECLRTPPVGNCAAFTDDPLQSPTPWFRLGVAKRPFTVLDQAGKVVYDPTSPTAGFDTNGRLCQTFNPNPSDNNCPFRLELSWQVTCPSSPAPCTGEDITVRIRGVIYYRPRASSDRAREIAFNPGRYGIDFIRGSTDVSTADIGEGEMNFLAKWQSSKTLTTSRVHEDASRNLGIGTGLDTYGRSSLTLRQKTDGGADGFTLMPRNGHAVGDFLRLFIDGNGVGRLRFDNGAEPLTVTRNGTVGVATASPQAPLHVNGKAKVMGYVQIAGDTSSHTCAAAENGSMRYNPALPNIEFCAAGTWRPLGGVKPPEAQCYGQGGAMIATLANPNAMCPLLARGACGMASSCVLDNVSVFAAACNGNACITDCRWKCRPM